MRPDFDTALDRCLTLLRRGESLDSCLARYPEYADRLRPLLEMAIQVGRVISPLPSQSARVAGEQRMLAAMAQKRQREQNANPILQGVRRFSRFLARAGGAGWRPAWNMVGMAAAILLLVVGLVVVAASANSLPGDVLYAVKLVGHSLQLSLTFDSQRHQRLEDRFQAQGRDDVRQALKGSRQARVEFEGVLQSMEGNLWTIGGLPVAVQATTVVAGRPAVGRLVQVRGQLAGAGMVLADEIDVGLALTPEPTAVAPTATPRPSETPPSTWTPAPTETSRPTGTLQPADTARPTATPRPSETPEPTQTPEPTETALPTATPSPSATPVPATATPTLTPEPADSEDRQEGEPQATATPSPTEAQPTVTSPPPTATPRQTDTPRPTRTHEPTDTPHPTDGPHATDTPHPTETPHPTAAHPTDTPHPTETPHPTKTPEGDDD